MQTGAMNTADVLQAVTVGSGGTQTATQTVEVTQTQTSTGTGNLLGVLQYANQSLAGGSTQAQDAHQELTVHQTAIGAGTNTDGAAQHQYQSETAGVTQSQNTASGLTPCPAAGLFGVGTDPNACAYIAQTSDSGNNLNGLNQQINETETSGVATNQLQGSSEGGIGAQAELNSTSGASQNSVRQSKMQTAKGPTGVTQTQIDPTFCCGISANGNASSTETLSQSSTQTASSPSPTQQLEVLGLVHAPNGSCSITQTADGTTSTNSSSTCATPIGFETTCTTTTTSSGCTSEPLSTLTVQTTGTGSGTVTSSPSGINCSSGSTANCSDQFPDGTVTLTASPSEGSVLGSWTGCSSTDGPTCIVTLNADTTVTAEFCRATQPCVFNTDVAEFGYGGMRGTGAGLITVSGVSGTVTKALLYWNGPTNSTDPAANAAVTFADTQVTGTNIGFASDNCWGFQNSQSYRADVTSLVTGNGTYSLSNFDKPGVEINGVALIVFYNDGNTANDRNVVMFNGNDSNVDSTFDLAGWDETIAGVPYPGSGSASLDFVVSDGQSYEDDALVLNGQTLVPTGGIFQGDSTPAGSFNGNPLGVTGSLWDVKSFDITSFLSSGSNNLHLTTGLASDCLSLVVAMANVPAAAPIG